MNGCVAKLWPSARWAFICSSSQASRRFSSLFMRRTEDIAHSLRRSRKTDSVSFDCLHLDYDKRPPLGVDEDRAKFQVLL